MQTLTFEINGMSCGHCVKAVEKALASVDGVITQTVAIGSATVSLDPARTSAQLVTDAITDAGYQVTATH